jgi:4'-phosphopantetheinyl transferase
VVLCRADVDEVASDHGWLTEAERGVLATLRVPKRRADWRLGRWVAKKAVADAVGAHWLSRDSIEILATPGGRPACRIRRPGPWPRVALSLSHSGGTGFAAALRDPALLGCDVEQVAGRSEAFVTDYFTAEEGAWIRSVPAERALRANLLWSAKESALKAMGEGLRLDPRSVRVVVSGTNVGSSPAPHGGSLIARVSGGVRLVGRWWYTRSFVWTVLTDGAHEIQTVPSGLPHESTAP